MGQRAATQTRGGAPSASEVEEARQKVRAMSIKELKVYLSKANVDTSTAVEKGDLVRRALEVAERGGPTLVAGPPPKRAGGSDICFCWKWLLPETAPEWYVAKLGGRGSGGDVHNKPAPAGSLFALGHVELKVPDVALARAFYETGLGFVKSSRGAADEVRLNAGPSQLWLKVAPGQEAERWPGDIRVWVDDIQNTYDHMCVTDGELGMNLVSEYGEGINGGEFSMKVLDPFLKTFFVMTEAPKGRKELITKQIGCEACAMKSNVAAISDLSVKCKSRQDMQLFGEFYKHFFGAAVTILQYSCMVHFSPGKELHQTITFVEDTNPPPPTSLGSLCFYVASKDAFKEAYLKCLGASLVEAPGSWEQADRSLEFVLKGIIDPLSGKMLLPLRSIIRCAGHLDCLVNS